MRKLKPKYKWATRIRHFKMLNLQNRRQKWLEEQTLLAAQTFGTKEHTRYCMGIAGVLEGKRWTEDEVKTMGVNPKGIDFKELNEEISKFI